MKNLLVILMAVMVALFSCTKEEVTQENYKLETKFLNYDGNQYKLSMKRFENNKLEFIIDEDYHFLKELFSKTEDPVFFFDENDETVFYPTREDFVLANQPTEISGIKCEGNSAARVKFFKHTNYGTQLDVQGVNTITNFKAYPLNTGSGSNLYTVYNAYGFMKNWVGSSNNDEMSSLYIDAFKWGNISTASRTSEAYNINSFYIVLFNHADYRGQAISFKANKCSPLRDVKNLKNYNFWWVFGNWNDRVSSYYGYHAN